MLLLIDTVLPINAYESIRSFSACLFNYIPAWELEAESD